MSNAKAGYRGYIGSRSYRSGSFTQQIQNLVIRTYCQQRQLDYLLSATEYAIPGCYMMLNEVLNSLESIEGIVLFSIYMLPETRERRHAIYNQILDAGCTLHSAFEDLTINQSQDIKKIEDIWGVCDIVASDNLMKQIQLSDVSQYQTDKLFA